MRTDSFLADVPHEPEVDQIGMLMDPSILYSRVRLGTGRRLASPVRLSLAPQFGGTVAGAWWPRVTYLAHELADLIDAVYQPSGALTDITLNWPSTEGTPDLDSASFTSPMKKT